MPHSVQHTSPIRGVIRDKEPWLYKENPFAGERCDPPESHAGGQPDVQTIVLPVVPLAPVHTSVFDCITCRWSTLYPKCLLIHQLPRLHLCDKLGIYWVLEQPTSSLAFYYKPLRRLVKRQRAKRVRCSLGAFNAATLKPVSWQHYLFVEQRLRICCISPCIE